MQPLIFAFAGLALGAPLIPPSPIRPNHSSTLSATGSYRIPLPNPTPSLAVRDVHVNRRPRSTGLRYHHAIVPSHHGYPTLSELRVPHHQATVPHFYDPGPHPTSSLRIEKRSESPEPTTVLVSDAPPLPARSKSVRSSSTAPSAAEKTYEPWYLDGVQIMDSHGKAIEFPDFSTLAKSDQPTATEMSDEIEKVNHHAGPWPVDPGVGPVLNLVPRMSAPASESTAIDNYNLHPASKRAVGPKPTPVSGTMDHYHHHTMIPEVPAAAAYRHAVEAEHYNDHMPITALGPAPSPSSPSAAHVTSNWIDHANPHTRVRIAPTAAAHATSDPIDHYNAHTTVSPSASALTESSDRLAYLDQSPPPPVEAYHDGTWDFSHARDIPPTFTSASTTSGPDSVLEARSHTLEVAPVDMQDEHPERVETPLSHLPPSAISTGSATEYWSKKCGQGGMYCRREAEAADEMGLYR